MQRSTINGLTAIGTAVCGAFLACGAAVFAGCGDTGDTSARVRSVANTVETQAPEQAADTGVVIDRELPSYRAMPGVSGSLRAAGSDTMLNLTTQWSGSFAKAHPSVQPQVEGKGSSSAPPSLLENQAQFGPMSRAMGDEEIDLFTNKFGYEPTELRTAIDCVAVFVHRDNPIEAISLPALEAAFAVGGGATTWGDLGVTDPAWSKRPLSLYGRNSASGTYKFFKDNALGGTDFLATVKEQPGSSGVVRAIATDRFGIGYSGIGYESPLVKAIAVSYEEGESPSIPTPATAKSGAYPLARFLYVYLNYDAAQPLDRLREAFVRFIFSREGQEEVVKDGAYPVSAEIAREELEKLGLEPGF